jgi:uncharacterized coiled-coil protein SlyX
MSTDPRTIRINSLEQQVANMTSAVIEMSHVRGTLVDRLKTLSERVHNQRQQIRELDEKLAAMKTWRGWVRTAGQKLGLSR